MRGHYDDIAPTEHKSDIECMSGIGLCVCAPLRYKQKKPALFWSGAK